MEKFNVAEILSIQSVVQKYLSNYEFYIRDYDKIVFESTSPSVRIIVQKFLTDYVVHIITPKRCISESYEFLKPLCSYISYRLFLIS